MDRASLEREVRRLAPWYYLWDLRGVRTDITPPCDDQGHRQVFCPPIYDGFWTGKRVLDVACNEGAYGLGALGHGAQRLVGFDCREANVEKASFVARVLEHEHASFEVADCDSWIAAHPDEEFDVVVLCGILYHLTDPLKTIRDYCGVARDWVFVTCCVQGSEEDGFTWTTEGESVAASRDARDSLMPNNASTLIRAFRRHGFEPVHVEEACKGDFWDGVNLLLRNCGGTSSRREAIDEDPGEVAVHFAPEPRVGDSHEVHVAVDNRTDRPRSVRALTQHVAANGDLTPLGEEALELPARSLRPGIPASQSVHRTASLEVEASGSATLEVRILDGDRLVGGGRITIGPESRGLLQLPRPPLDAGRCVPPGGPGVAAPGPGVSSAEDTPERRLPTAGPR